MKQPIWHSAAMIPRCLQNLAVMSVSVINSNMDPKDAFRALFLESLTSWYHKKSVLKSRLKWSDRCWIWSGFTWNNCTRRACCSRLYCVFPDSKVHGANMGPIWGRQYPGGPHFGPMNLAIWVASVFASVTPVFHDVMSVRLKLEKHYIESADT